MCKANDIYVPVLVGDETTEQLREQEQRGEELTVNENATTNNDATSHDRQHGENDDDDDINEQCDVVTWAILFGGLVMLAFIAAMPCSCAVVEDIESRGSSLLRGAAQVVKQLPHDKEALARIFITNDQAESNFRSFVEPNHHNHFDPRIGKLVNYQVDDDEEDSEDHEIPHYYVHKKRGQPMAVDYPIDDAENANDIPVTTVDDEHHQALQHIFSTSNVKHLFISVSGSNDEHAELLESRSESSSDHETSAVSSSHEIVDSSPYSTNAQPSSLTENVSPKSYSVSYDEVVIDTNTDKSESGEILEPATSRRKIQAAVVEEA